MSVFENRYNKLNEEQKEAVDLVEGPVMVVAGPGSGKTELMSVRIANILDKTDASPEDILCLTFTDSAAHNLRERLASLIGIEAYKVAVHTFHSFGSEIINHHPECFYNGANYKPIDDISKIEIIEQIIKDLKWDSDLKKNHPTQGYTYLNSVKSRIDEIKKGGLLPSEFKDLILENYNFEEKINPIINQYFSEKISLKTIPLLSEFLQRIEEEKFEGRKYSLSNYKTLKDSILESLRKVIEECETEEEKRRKTVPITVWKKRFLKKNSKGDLVLKSSLQSKNLLDLSDVYEKYQERIHAGGFYDFTDMILDTVRELENNSELRYEIQEKFLYVLVDEFQDTSGVQMRFLDTVLNKEINEGRPNIFVVGDDDQSIYKFQGASLDNINNFFKKYKDVKKVVLSKNYRSGQNILDYSEGIIREVEDRLTNRDSEIIKKMICSNPNIGEGKVNQKEFQTKLEQFIYIAEEIQNKIENNSKEEIAIISRNHKDLEEIVTILNYYNVPFKYDRNKNILEEKHVQQIIIISKFINSLNRNRIKEAEELLPEILSFEFWGIDRVDVWRVCNSANKNRKKSWLEVMLDFGGKVSTVASFLIALGSESKRHTLEETLDYMIGSEKIKDLEYTSEFKKYYFSSESFEDNRIKYLECLFDLNTLFEKLRKYRNDKVLYIKDFIEFLDLHETHHMSIYKNSKLSSGKNAVNLLTAHKAKGLEFDSVFIINCNENSWMKSRNDGKLALPVNIPLVAEKDNIDDKTRLFFVAVTRAKNNLYLTNYLTSSENDKVSDRLRFLDQDLSTKQIEPLNIEKSKAIEELLSIKEDIRHYKINNADEEELLKSMLENYKLSVTHLNNFLDVTKGGPLCFLEQNLLHFPRAKSVSGSYGTAIHESFNDFYNKFKSENRLPELEEFLNIFEIKLSLQDLNEKAFGDQLKRGQEELSFYYSENYEEMKRDDLLEIDFKNEGVKIGECLITGKIDRISVLNKEKKEFKVFDYKTGKSFSSWNPKDDYLKIKALKYKDQLVFYKILMENSRTFKGANVVSGGIDFITKDYDELIKLNLEISSEDVENLKALIDIVYKKIMDLDFVDVSKYPQNAKGIEAFRDDLLVGRI